VWKSLAKEKNSTFRVCGLKTRVFGTLHNAVFVAIVRSARVNQRTEGRFVELTFCGLKIVSMNTFERMSLILLASSSSRDRTLDILLFRLQPKVYVMSRRCVGDRAVCPVCKFRHFDRNLYVGFLTVLHGCHT
jgi:hypothetical protein